MSTQAPDQSQLDQILRTTQEIRSEIHNDRVLDLLEVVRDHVGKLSSEHDALRDDIRDIIKLLAQQAMQQSAAPAD